MLKPLGLSLMLLCTPLAACETLPRLPTPQSTLVDEKALLAAEAAFQGVLIGVSAAVDSGALKGADATKARVGLEKARSALLVARRTKATADAFSVLNLAADLKGMIQ